jgi:MoaA/NifB/PqqE/SkfB family radical SAM enzyme
MSGEHHARIYSLKRANADLAALKEFYDDLVPPVFPGRFPASFRLVPADWYLRPDVVHRPAIRYRGDWIRPIGTLDVEMISDELLSQAKSGVVSLSKRYPCGLKCPGCFSEDNTYADGSRLLSWREVYQVIDQAREIGLRSVKFLGPGELVQNPDLFEILDAAEERHLPISVFTKGVELGDDELAAYVHGRNGIRSSTELVDRLASYKCLRILLGFNSFDPIRQDKMVGSSGVTGHYQVSNGIFLKRGVERYTEKRNRALVNLVRYGFSSEINCQRLSLIAAPVGLDQIDEIPEMYVWAARRNIPLVIAPTMESGPKSVGLMKYNKKSDPAHEKLRALFVRLYSRALEEGVLDAATVKREGISAYMGTAPCNQIANGLYLRLNGSVQICPGAFDEASIFGNIHEKSFVDIWRGSANYQLGALENNWCKAKKNGMPPSLQEDVLMALAVSEIAKLCAGSFEEHDPNAGKKEGVGLLGMC